VLHYHRYSTEIPIIYYHCINKKSELMLMRRATASVYFYTVVVLVRNFVKNSLYKCYANKGAWNAHKTPHKWQR